MRKETLLLFVVSLSSATICFGQIAKGSVLLGGDLSAYTENQTDNNGIVVKNNGFFISPLAGKAIKNNLFLGGYFNLGISKDEGTNASNAFKSHSYGVGIFLRKYGGIKNNFFGFLQANLGANYYSQDLFPGLSTYTIIQRTIAATLSPGLSFKVSKKLHLEAGLRELVNLGYSNMETSDDNSGTPIHNKSNRFYISSSLNNFGSSLYFGFRLLINTKAS